MTNAGQSIEHLRAFLPSLRHLGRLHKLLGKASESVRNFCSWGHRQRTRFIPLFDFDIVCGALPSVATRNFIKSYDLHRSRSMWPQLGPHSVAATLLNLGHFKFSLPLGALAELMARQEELQTGISKSAEDWIRAFEHTMNRPDPGAKLLSTSTGQASVENVLLDAFLDLASDFDDVRVLESVTAKHVPFGNLVLDIYDSKVPRSFQETAKRLDKLRPWASRNNRIDAINISNVVRMFNHPVLEKVGERPMPLLITETKEVFRVFSEATEEESWYDLSPYNEQPPLILQRVMFLQLYWHFLTDCQFAMRTAAREAILFARESNKLASQYLLVSDLIESLIDPDVPDRPRIFEVEYQLDWLVEQQRVFDNDWGRVVINSIRSAEQDRISYVNLLRNDHFRSHLAHSIGEKLKKKHWEGAIRQLQEFRQDFEFWQLVDEYTRRPIVVNTSASSTPSTEAEVQREYRISFDVNTGESLLTERPGRDLGKAGSIDLNQSHELRFLVHRRKVSNACVFCADSWLYDTEPRIPFLAIAWAHRCDTRTLWEKAQPILRSFFDSTSDENALALKTFGPTAMAEKALTATRSDVLQANVEENCVYVELSRARRVVYADLVSEDSLEMQLGIVFPRQELSDIPLRLIADFISTTNINPMPNDHCLLLLEELKRFFIKCDQKGTP